MGEYAKFNGNDIKIGTCERMYYLRLDDTDKLKYLDGNINARIDTGLFFRLPFPDEDNIQPGNYEVHNRGYRLYKTEKEGTHEWTVDFSDPTLAENTGIIQFHNDSGILINVKCMHGEKLPEETKDVSFGWNGRSWFYELTAIKKHKDAETGIIKLFPVIHCRFCGQLWRYDWDDILPFVQDEILKERLIKYSEMVF
jgi:hypothetical protein